MDIKQNDKQYILQTYKRQNLAVTRAKGKYVYDENGMKYLDFFTGISVCNVGHCNPKVVSAVKKQTVKLMHASNHYYTGPQGELAKRLIGLSFPGRVFLSNSGAEANECAIKLARKWGNSLSGAKKYEVISFTDSFHGRTLATLAATAQEKFHKGFEPMPEGFKYARFNNLESLSRLAGDKTAAVIIEPVQGEGGINIADKEFLAGVRKICDEKNIMLIFDEIQCGMGRTGTFFAYEQYGVVPDVVTLAKSLAGGLPLGATIISEKYASILGYGDHGSTFGGNPVSCAAAVAVLDVLDGLLMDKVKTNGAFLLSKLKKLKKKYSFIKEARGIGLMAAIELDFPGSPSSSLLFGGQAAGREIVESCLAKGLLINCTNDKVLRFLPPFIVSKSDINKAVKIFDEALSQIK
jgi:acetylornithine/N-succinyldiaminopimelate aminotransferase